MLRLTASAIWCAAILAAGASSALALTCSNEPIEVRGEQSRYVWLAKSKAKANWRAKVRKTTGLGAPYSNWARASNTDERCLTGPAGTVCIFKGTPCIP